MNRDRLVVALLALLTAVALGVGATAIDDVATSGSGDGPGGRDGDGPGRGDSIDVADRGTGSADAGWLRPILIVLGALLLLLAAYVLLDAMTPRLALILLSVLVLGILLALLLSHLQFEVNPQPVNESLGTPGTGQAPDAGGGGGSGGSGSSAPGSAGATLALFAALVVLGGFAIYHFSGDAAPEPSDEGQLDEDVRAVGEAAGRAADRIDERSLENAIYRAWREMTDALDVPNPRSTTPAEFADAAIDAGLDRDDVERLTDLFRTVRYGDAPVTEEREEQARTILRRIEATYAETDADVGDARADFETDVNDDTANEGSSRGE